MGKQTNSSDTPKPSAREVILDTATTLFFRDGYHAVGVDTIIEQSGVAKMTLYRHFPSKDALIVAYLEHTNGIFWEWFDASLGDGTPREQIEHVFDAVGILSNNPMCYGCAFQNTAAEFPALDHPGHQVALQHKLQVIERLTELATRAALRDPDTLAKHLLLPMDGAWVAARLFGPHNPAVHIGDAARALIAAHTP